MNKIEIGNITVDVFHKKIKNLHLAVQPPEGRVRIASPLRVKDEAIRLFVTSKLPWIKRQQKKFREQERETEREFLSRESHYFFGKRYLLNVIEHDGPPGVILKKNTIDMYVRQGTTTEKRKIIMNEWYRKEIKKVIPELLEKWEKITGVSASQWRVKLMKTRWGTCNIKSKRIWFNLELAKKPVYCLEYIIVHELVHLLERHHNENFVKLMEQFMPQWNKYKEELNRLPAGYAGWDD
ncbi:MAG: SprT family zinc-dependent metalloprotease [Candidatus Eremiobacterota bacterium]